MRNRVAKVAVLTALMAAPLQAEHHNPPSPSQDYSTPTFFQIDPRASFLRASPLDAPVMPTIIDLRNTPDDALLQIISQGYFTIAGNTGSVKDPTTDDWFMGIFSSTDEVFADVLALSRVPGSVTSELGADAYTSINTFYDDLPTDIPNDFSFVASASNPFLIHRPAGANYLILGVVDNQYQDNVSADPSNLGIWLKATPTTVTPEPQTMVLLGSGLGIIGVAGAIRRRRQGSQMA